MTLSEELDKNNAERKQIVRGYMKELRDSYTIIAAYEAAYGKDLDNYPSVVHVEIMDLVARAKEIHIHIPVLRKSFELDNAFTNVTSEIDILLNDS